MIRVEEPVALMLGEAGAPVELTWRGRRFRVNDTPTTLVGPCDWWRPFSAPSSSHPPSGVPSGSIPLQIAGWRFQAANEDGDARVFDVAYGPGEQWELLRVFE